MDIYEKNLKEVEEKTNSYEKNVFKQILIGLWAFAVIITSVCAFDGGEVLYIITGVLADIGAVLLVIREYKTTVPKQK